MADKSPLKLLVEPGEYLCVWMLPSAEGSTAELSGALSLRAGYPPTGEVYGDVPIRWTETSAGHQGAGFPQQSRFAYVRARLANGMEVDLVDVTVEYWFPERGRIRAASAVVGAVLGPRGFGWGTDELSELCSSPVDLVEEPPRYDHISVQVKALDALAGASPFSSWTFPRNDGSRYLEGTWTVSGNPDSSQEWNDSDATVRMEYDASVGVGNRYAFRFTVSPVVRVESRRALTVREWVDQWVTPLCRIVSIATGAPQSLTYLAVAARDEARSSAAPGRHAIEDNAGAGRGGGGDAPLQKPAPETEHPRAIPLRFRRRQVFGSGITQDPFASDEESVRRANTSIYLAQDDVSLLGMLREWQKLESEHHPLVETYGAMLGASSEHPRSRFLLLVQALEGLHGHETADAYSTRQQRHDETRQAVLSALDSQSILSAKHRRFLRNNLARRPQRGLDEALRRLLTALPVDLTPRLSKCGLLTSYLSEAEGSEVQRVAYAVSRVRNDLAHGNRGFDTYELTEAVEVLERVVRAHALRILGCTAPVLERVCDLDR